MSDEAIPRPWSLFVHDEQEGGDGEVSICAEGEWIATMNLRRSTAKADAALIVAAVNEKARNEQVASAVSPFVRQDASATLARVTSERDRLLSAMKAIEDLCKVLDRTDLWEAREEWLDDAIYYIRKEARAAIKENEK